jgi:hypothetical protein
LGKTSGDTVYFLFTGPEEPLTFELSKLPGYNLIAESGDYPPLFLFLLLRLSD